MHDFAVTFKSVFVLACIIYAKLDCNVREHMQAF